MRADLLHVVLGLAVLAATVWLPGLALCRLLAPSMFRLAALAAAPAVGCGLLYGAGQLLTAAELPVDGRLHLVTAVAGLGSLVWTERRQWRAWTPTRLPPSVAGAWLLGAGIWVLGIRHILAVPPHNDGYNHGFFVARIARHATLDPAIAMPHDVLSGGTGAAFYPLALHQQAAELVRLLDLDVGVAWTLASLSIVTLALPLGMYALGRHLFPDHPRAIAACAWVAALTPGGTYSTSWWGGFSMAAGLALTPGALLCVIHAAKDGAWVRPALLSGLALAGVAGVHTSEFTLLGVVAGVIVLGPAVARPAWAAAARGTGRIAVCFGAALLALLPALTQLQRGLDERTYDPEAHGLPFGKTVLEVLVQFSFVPPATPPALVLAAWVGIGLVLRHRVALPWLATWALFGVLYVWLAAFPSQFVTSLTSSWYSDRFRLGMMLSFLAIPFAALALAGPTPDARGDRVRLWRPSAIALAAVLAITSVVDSVSAIRKNYGNYSLVGADQRAAFAFLATHARPGERVLNQHQDGSPWMYSLYDVAPVFAVKTNNYESSDWDDALYLSKRVGEAGRDPRVDELLDHLDVRYVYVGDRVFSVEKPDLRAKVLAASPEFREVFTRGTAHIFERTSP